MTEKVEKKENDNFRQMFKRLNLLYINLIQQMGGDSEQREYAQTVLGLDGDIIKLLASLKNEEKQLLADLGAPLFRLQLSDLDNARCLYNKGQLDRAASALTAALADGHADRGIEK